MTEYDFSPEAYERYIVNQSRIAKWRNHTEQRAAVTPPPIFYPKRHRLPPRRNRLPSRRNSDGDLTSTGEKVITTVGDRRRSSFPEWRPVKQRPSTPCIDDPSDSDDSSNSNESRHSAASHHSSALRRSTSASSRRRAASYRRPVSHRRAASHDGTRSTSSFSHAPNSHLHFSPLVKVKVHFYEDVFVMRVSRSTEYAELVDRVGKRIRLYGSLRDDDSLRVKYKDEAGDMISLASTEDLQMAFQTCQRGGQITLFVTCSDVQGSAPSPGRGEAGKAESGQASKSQGLVMALKRLGLSLGVVKA